VQYLKFLQILIALGPKLPAILAWLQAGFELLKGLLPTPVPEDSGSLQMVQADECAAEAERLEGEVAAIVAGPNAAFDGTRLRGLFKFLQDSGLLTILIGILTKTGG